MKFLSSFEYNSRRSAIFSSRGMAASSQPEATAAGVKILRRGGNAADAAVAMAAALQVTQPCSTGLGGDCFCLYYSAAEKRVYAMNGSGRSPGKLNLTLLQDQGFEKEIPSYHAHTVTVPGAPAGWVDTVERFGSLPMSSILEPAIDLAENGFPVGQLTANWWGRGAEKQLALYPHGGELMINGRGPRPGEVFKNLGLAAVLRTMAEEGAAPFYSGWIAERVVSAVQQEGGVLSMADLAQHTTEWIDPISVDYKGVTVWECPPNGQGIAALIGLNILSQFDLRAVDRCTRYHLLIESMRLAFADAGAYVADPAISPVPVEDLLSKSYAANRAAMIDRNVRIPQVDPGSFAPAATGGDTVYFSTADRDGNGCSFINSNYMGFGTGIVPQGCGFSLQNRGKG
ncbi:MAG: gamma-glutamyltransferase, partial [Spirochaetales bacterium]|nr:gamma-glutamyltransferase [Spirochaetales bacterium]